MSPQVNPAQPPLAAARTTQKPPRTSRTTFCTSPPTLCTSGLTFRTSAMDLCTSARTFRTPRSGFRTSLMTSVGSFYPFPRPRRALRAPIPSYSRSYSRVTSAPTATPSASTARSRSEKCGPTARRLSAISFTTPSPSATPAETGSARPFESPPLSVSTY